MRLGALERHMSLCALRAPLERRNVCYLEDMHSSLHVGLHLNCTRWERTQGRAIIDHLVTLAGDYILVNMGLSAKQRR